mmetsp:Transcript_31026/g.81154  ORF Transcript_31026/g.81154 Transcript_31026/m.81154 type:complete len:456 (-) Transcript_31026:153-1520(-)
MPADSDAPIDDGVKDFVEGRRNGVRLTEDLVRRKAEHNEGMLSTLEEIALHQLDIDKIETLNNCRCLKIVYLQHNLITKIEGLYKLKHLDYLNLALNLITKVEGLERCEALFRLDLTCNFIDLDELASVASLKENLALRELFLTGNPLTAHWESGYRDYVVATLPQLTKLDGTDISRTERIKAMQRLPELERELASLAPIAAERKKEQRERQRERQRRIDDGELVVDKDTVDEWCPEIRVQDSRELRKIEEDKNEYRRKTQNSGGGLFGDQPKRERSFFKEDGTPNQMNTAKWPFSIEEDGAAVYVDIALPKFLDSAQVDADVQPNYVRVTAKKNILQLVLPSEVLTDASTAKRSTTTGHLQLTCPKLCPVVVSKAPVEKKKKERERLQSTQVPTPMLQPPPSESGANLKPLSSADSVGQIVAQNGQPRKKEARADMAPQLGPDYDEEDDVPPLL